jgi:Tfp pilus assembly protein PilX
MMKQIRERQTGAVSLFVVIFAALLMTIVTVSFVQLMIKDQQQATLSDLSQSAYDSAQAGVEDAKRLLLLDQSCKNGTAASAVNCSAIANALVPVVGQSETSCDTLARSGIVSETNDETIIQQSEGDASDQLDQAYTCVKIRVNTDDYRGDVGVNESDVVPIRGVSAFDTVELSWFSRDDVSADTNDLTVGFPSTGADVSLPPVGNKWQFNYPPLMRTQLMQLGSGAPLTDFDSSQPGNKSNANTLFLYPTENGLTEKDFALDARRSPSNAPQPIKCNDSFVTGEFACKVTLHLPAPINGSNDNRNAFLRLTALYNKAHYKITLKNGSEIVKFDQVQPEVDSTGRANDLFRRILARVELKGDFTYPEAAVDMTGNLCKNFMITDQEAGYQAATCTP